MIFSVLLRSKIINVHKITQIEDEGYTTFFIASKSFWAQKNRFLDPREFGICERRYQAKFSRRQTFVKTEFKSSFSVGKMHFSSSRYVIQASIKSSNFRQFVCLKKSKATVIIGYVFLLTYVHWKYLSAFNSYSLQFIEVSRHWTKNISIHCLCRLFPLSYICNHCWLPTWEKNSGIWCISLCSLNWALYPSQTFPGSTNTW